jgi:hypothetical protein
MKPMAERKKQKGIEQPEPDPKLEDRDGEGDLSDEDLDEAAGGFLEML